MLDVAHISNFDVSLVVAGVLLLVVGVPWSLRGRRKRTSEEGLRAALQAPDPSARIAGLMLAAERGVNENAPDLLTVARSEEDPGVLDALAKIVAQHQWEPVSRPEAIELRLWARDWLGGRRARAVTPRVSAGDVPAGVPLSEPGRPTEEAPSPSENAWPMADAAESVTVVTKPAVPAAPDAAEAGDFPTVLVTGAGGPAGVCVIRALRAMGVRVVAADPDDTAVGLHLADAAGRVLPADDPRFLESVCELGRTSGAGALVSTVSEELPVLAEGRQALVGAGLATWLPDVAAARTCLDKWALAQVFAAAAISHPSTSDGRKDGVPGPWIVKPRFGRGSRDVYAIEDEAEVEWALRRTPNAVVQTRLEGVEFTIDALVDRDGTLAGAVPRWRLETKAGVSTKGRTFEDPLLLEQTAALLAAIGLQGPANVQGFLLSDSGLYSFTEVNPRFSGGLSLSLAAGANLVGEYLRGIMGLPVRREQLAYDAGVTMERYYEDVILR
jgi:carbamoyl-phosphate synthase large subunit